MRTLLAVTAAVAVLLVGASLSDDASPTTDGDTPVSGGAAQDGAVAQSPTAPQVPRPSPGRDQAPGAGELLQAAAHGDGDSWRDTAGTEYRLGLVNAPEQGKCFGAEATAERQRQVAAGFRAAVYSRDRYGRAVAVVTTADGTNLNVHLARQGFVDDRYLNDFREENAALAGELDVAFAEARARGRGLWSACAAGQEAAVPPPAAPAAAARGGCHPDYLTCIPVAGDGSGNGRGNDLDCGNLQGSVQARQAGVDPYRLDGDGDGVGCDG